MRMMTCIWMVCPMGLSVGVCGGGCDVCGSGRVRGRVRGRDAYRKRGLYDSRICGARLLRNALQTGV